MVVAVPVRDMKNTASFVELVESEREVIVTKNGRDAICCISTEQRRIEREELAKAKLLSRIMLAESEADAEDWEEYSSFSARIRARYEL